MTETVGAGMYIPAGVQGEQSCRGGSGGEQSPDGVRGKALTTKGAKP